MKVQNYLEDYYSTWENFPQTIYNAMPPQSACVVTDINGKILGLVGGIGEKTVSRGFIRATMAKRHPGSSIKPIGAYSVAFEYDRITWSTLMDDNPVEGNFPLNFDRVYRGPITIDYAIRNSVNTIAVRVVDMLTPRVVFDYLKNSLHMDSLIERQIVNNQVFSDIDRAPMALGSLTEGLTPVEMAGGYQVFANGGTFTEPYAYYEVRDAEDKIVLKPNTQPLQVISPETATVLNKLLQGVTTAGTGSGARLQNMPAGG
jgi:penicillin-binding protein 1A